MNLLFNVAKQTIYRKDSERVVRDSQNYLHAVFTLSEEWSAPITAVFKSKSGAFNVLLDENNTCLVPWEVLTDSEFIVSVFCGDLITANVVKVPTTKSGYEIGQESRTPTPDVFTQITEAIGEIDTKINNLNAESIPYDNTQSGIEAETIQQAIDIIAEGGGGSGEGDMKKSVYDPEQNVANAGGIPDYVSSQVSGFVSASDAQTIAINADKSIENIVVTDKLLPLQYTIEKKFINTPWATWASGNSAEGTTLTVQEGEVYLISGTYIGSTALYALFNGNTKVSVYPAAAQSVQLKTRETVEVTIPSGVNELRACSYSNDTLVIKKVVKNGALRVDTPFNYLYGKKWAACGDSFTAGDFSGYVDPDGNTGKESDAYDREWSMYKTYPYWIAKRNGMNLQLLADGGNDFTNISGATRPFSVTTTANYNYTQIAADCDYITIQFGLNESTMTTEQIGTRTDSTNETLWGAYNIVLEAILTANPDVKIGIIISDAWLSQEYHDALIEIAKYWGIPYLDLRDGEQVPMMINGRLSACSSVAKTLRDGVFKVTNSNGHPGLIGHKYRSTVIEHFLRSL